MRIKQLLENAPMPPRYHAVVTDNGDANHWDDHSDEEVLEFALSEELDNAGIPTRVFIHKIENGVDTILSQPDDDDYTGVEKLKKFLANNGSVEDDLV